MNNRNYKDTTRCNSQTAIANVSEIHDEKSGLGEFNTH